jgi:CheY-like chemotaxis protein
MGSNTRLEAVPKILLVEDERILGELVHFYLTHQGRYHVDVVETLKEGRSRLIAENSYAGVVCDTNLPDGLGPELVNSTRDDTHYASSYSGASRPVWIGVSALPENEKHWQNVPFVLKGEGYAKRVVTTLDGLLGKI